MDVGVVTRTGASGAANTRRALRYAAAALSLAVGALYVLIALQLITVASTEGKESPFVPMAGAGAAFILGAVLLLVFDKRIVYLLGALVQVVVIIGYFAVASSRSPHYETWGLLMKIAQVVVLALLLYLALRAPNRRASIARARRRR